MIDDIDSHERPGQGRGLVTSPWWISAASSRRLTSGSPAHSAHAMALLVEPTAMREPISPAAPVMRMVIGKAEPGIHQSWPRRTSSHNLAIAGEGRKRGRGRGRGRGRCGYCRPPDARGRDFAVRAVARLSSKTLTLTK